MFPLSNFQTSLLNYAPLRLRALPIIDTRLRAYAPYPSLIHALHAYAPLLTNKHLTSNLLQMLLLLTSINLEKNKYSEEPKTALVRPISRKMKETSKIRNYRPVSILNGMSKIYGRCIHNSLSSYAETILIKFHISL